MKRRRRNKNLHQKGFDLNFFHHSHYFVLSFFSFAKYSLHSTRAWVAWALKIWEWEENIHKILKKSKRQSVFYCSLSWSNDLENYVIRSELGFKDFSFSRCCSLYFCDFLRLDLWWEKTWWQKFDSFLTFVSDVNQFYRKKSSFVNIHLVILIRQFLTFNAYLTHYCLFSRRR